MGLLYGMVKQKAKMVTWSFWRLQHVRINVDTHFFFNDNKNNNCDKGKTWPTWTTDNIPVIMTSKFGSLVKAFSDPAMTLKTAYMNRPNAETRSSISFRSLCSSVLNLSDCTLQLWFHIIMRILWWWWWWRWWSQTKQKRENKRMVTWEINKTKAANYKWWMTMISPKN